MAREHGKGMTLLFHQYISNKKTKNQNRSAFTMHRPHECAFISVHLFFQWKLKYPSIHTMDVFSLSVLEAKKKKKKIVARKQTTGMFNVATVPGSFATTSFGFWSHVSVLNFSACFNERLLNTYNSPRLAISEN